MQHLQKTRGRGGPFFPFWNSPLVSHPCIQALSFHALTHCPFCNSSLFTHMHVMGGCTPLLAMRLATAIPSSLSTNPYLLYFQTLAHSSALFCSRQKLNFFIFNLFRTLCQKHPGVGYVPLSPPQQPARSQRSTPGAATIFHQSRVTSHLLARGPCAILAFLSADRPFLPPRRSS